MSDKVKWESDTSINNLRDYLRIRSVHPDVNYGECIKFLKGQATKIGLPYQVFELLPNKPALVMTWEGLEPTLSSVLLNSHMDVVPVFEKSWSHPPFEAHMDEDGTIYGRGIQDMKSVAIQYLEAVARLKGAGTRLKRTVHLSFLPDEELGGGCGMGQFVQTEDFKKLNIGFSLDEGMACPTEEYIVFYGERSIWQFNIHCKGKSGHASLLHENTPGEKIRYIIDKFMAFREENKNKLQSNPELTIGDVTSVNLTGLKGGVQANVVPEELSATFDVRLDLSVDHKEFEDKIERWCSEAGPDVTCEFIEKQSYVASTTLDDTKPYWVAFKGAADQLGLHIKQRVFPGGTDSRFLRALGIPALGFSPMAGTRVQLHEHDESLKADTFLRGIKIYEVIVPALANV